MTQTVERMLPLYEATFPGDPRPRRAVEGTRGWVEGTVRVGVARAYGASARVAAREAAASGEPRAAAAAHLCAQTASVAHLAGKALGVHHYAAGAVDDVSVLPSPPIPLPGSAQV